MPVMLLLVDRHRELADLLCEYFKLNSSYEIRVVGIAQCGNQAVEMARLMQPNVVMLDEFTLQRNLFAVVRALRETPRPQKPAILAVETVCDEKCEKILRESGAAGCIGKPFDLERLAAKIRSVCAQNGCGCP